MFFVLHLAHAFLHMFLSNGRTGYGFIEDFFKKRGPLGLRRVLLSPCLFLFVSCFGKPEEELKRAAEDQITKEINEGVRDHHHEPFPFLFFEPFIPIRPHVWYWFCFDTSTVLRNVIIVCDRVAVCVQKYELATNMNLTVAEWRKQCRHEAILDSSLAWGYVAAQPANCIAASTHACSPLFRHIEHMCIDDVIKVHEYLHAGLPPTVSSAALDGDVAVV
jgi:hypothetical protein